MAWIRGSAPPGQNCHSTAMLPTHLAARARMPVGAIARHGGEVAISSETRKRLWVRSGNACALCHQELVRPDRDGVPGALIGEEAHIVARSPGRPVGHDTNFSTRKCATATGT